MKRSRPGFAFAKLLLETVWKVWAGVMVAYAPRYGEQEISHGSVRR